MIVLILVQTTIISEKSQYFNIYQTIQNLVCQRLYKKKNNIEGAFSP